MLSLSRAFHPDSGRRPAHNVPTVPLSAVALLFFFYLYAVASPPLAAADNPLEALETAQKGIDQADYNLFTQAIDVHNVLDKASDALFFGLRGQTDAGNLDGNDFPAVMGLIGPVQDSGQGALLKQLLLPEIKDFLATGINNGYFAGKPLDAPSSPRGSLAFTLKKMPEGRRQILPGRVLSHKGDKATVSAEFVDPGAGRLPLSLALEKQNGAWRVVELVNATDLVKKINSRTAAADTPP